MLMSAMNRRRFLELAGGGVAATMLSDSIARALAIPANRATRSLRDVEHIVVLTQENRSFDQYFGVMRGVRGFGDPHPVTLPSGRPVWYQLYAPNTWAACEKIVRRVEAAGSPVIALTVDNTTGRNSETFVPLLCSDLQHRGE